MNTVKRCIDRYDLIKTLLNTQYCKVLFRSCEPNSTVNQILVFWREKSVWQLNSSQSNYQQFLEANSWFRGKRKKINNKAGGVWPET